MEQVSDTREKVIQVNGLFKTFGNNAVLKDFSLDLYRGESLVVLGKSGSGKSVLIKCIIGLIRPESGSIHVLGQDVLSEKIKEARACIEAATC